MLPFEEPSPRGHWDRSSAKWQLPQAGQPLMSCRVESLDALHHLSSDGCMHSWLPSYVNFPDSTMTQGVSWCCCLVAMYRAAQPAWQMLLEVSAGLMLDHQVRDTKQTGLHNSMKLTELYSTSKSIECFKARCGSSTSYSNATSSSMDEFS